jgi:hypothetical protein
VAACAIFCSLAAAFLPSVKTLASSTANKHSHGKTSITDKASISFIREVEELGYKATFDTSHQFLNIDVEGVEDALQLPLFKNAASVQDVHAGEKPFVSASMLAAKSKQFDDGLCAAVELAAESGCGRMVGKNWLLKQLAEHLQTEVPDTSESPSIENVILGAASLGENGLKLASKNGSTRVFVDSFMHQELSKPLGFWSWSENLQTLFRQNRILQTELKPSPSLDSFTQFMKSDSKIWQAYSDYLDLESALVNPFTEHDFRYYASTKNTKSIQPGSGIYFLPPCASKEVALMRRLFGREPVPENFSVIDTMIAKVRSGEINLKPTSKSGWYDYHVWVLEALLTPEKNQESSRIDFSSEDYKEQLTEMFKGFLALSREVFVNELGRGGGATGAGSNTMFVAPEFTVEPLATFYLRRANAYRFVSKLLESTFGADGLQSMHRLGPDGRARRNLKEELDEMQALFCGAYLVACQESALQPLKTLQLDGSEIPAADADVFKHWALTAHQDKDVISDTRMMVPIADDPANHRTKVWAFCGWCKNTLSIWYQKAPKLISLTPLSPSTKNPPPQVEFTSVDSHEVAFPVCAEIYVDKVLDRNEFRHLCDKHKSINEILKALRAAP